MNDKSTTNNSKSPLAAVLRFTLIWILCFFTFNVLGAYLAAYLLGVDANNLDLTALATDENVWVLKLMQIIISTGSFLIPPLIYVFTQRESVPKYFGFAKNFNFKLLLSTVVIVFLSGPVVYWLLQINQSMNLPDYLGGLEQYLKSMEEGNGDMLLKLLSMETIGQLLVNLFMIAILPGLGEELLFRGVLQKLLGKFYKNPHLGIIGPAMIFSFIHFQFYGFLPRMALGMLFGYLYFWSGNLLYPIVGHILHNGAQIIMVYSLGSDFTEQELDAVGQFSPFMIMIATVFLLISLARFQNLSKSS